MDKKDTYLIAVALVICIVICCLSPYIASGDPEDFAVEEINGIPEAIFPDYAFANDPENQVLQIVALVIGAIVTLGLGYIVAEVVRSRN